MKTFEPLAHGRDNHFNLLRIIAASAVIVSHAQPIARGLGAVEPLEAFMPFSLGAAAVKLFFAISGFLVLKSWDRRPELAEFAIARALRIFPALIVVALVTAFAVGAVFTSLPLSAYYSDRSTIEYTPRVVSLYFMTHELPGVFLANPYPRAVNGSLWTLYYETLCYVALAAAGVAGILRRRLFPLLLVLYAAGYALRAWLRPDDFVLHASLSLPFVLGMAAYHYRRVVPVHVAIVAALALLAAGAVAAGVAAMEACTLAIAYGSLWAGQVNSPFLLRYNRIGDFSYGTYVYGWPVEQILVRLIPGIGPLALCGLAIPIAILCGAVSWFLVEKPALGQKRRAAELVRRARGALSRPRMGTA